MSMASLITVSVFSPLMMSTLILYNTGAGVYSGIISTKQVDITRSCWERESFGDSLARLYWSPWLLVSVLYRCTEVCTVYWGLPLFTDLSRLSRLERADWGHSTARYPAPATQTWKQENLLIQLIMNINTIYMITRYKVTRHTSELWLGQVDLSKLCQKLDTLIWPL